MEVASAGFLHSAPSPQREVGLSSDQESRSQLTSVKAGQRSNSPFDPAELEGMCRGNGKTLGGLGTL